MLAEYTRTKDVRVRDKIVLQYNNLVESIARRFSGALEPVEDLAQEGYIGLITAVDLYDASKGVKFSTYATHFVIGQIKHYLRDKGKIIKEPAWLQEINQKMSRVIDSLAQKDGRPPTEAEIATVMGLPEEQVAEMLTTREVFKVSSLDSTLERDDGTGTGGTVDPEKIKDNRTTSFQLPLEDKIVLETAMERLKDIEQQVIQHFFFADLNQTEIAKKLGISCNYVSHILRNSTKKLKKILMTDEIRDTQIQATQFSRRVTDQNRVAGHLTVVDGLTGIYNRRYYLDRLSEEITRASRYGHPVSVLLARITLPESVGKLARLIRTDDVIQQASERIRGSVRKADVIARIEDNVFALILPHTGLQAEHVASRVENILGAEAFVSPHTGESVRAEVQVAWASYPEHAGTARNLLSAATDSLEMEDLYALPLAA